MNNASPFLPPIPKKKKEKKDASLGWWCHLEAKVFCYAKPDRGVGFDRLFNCELFFLQGNWHLFAYITPSQSGKMNTDSSNIRRKWAEKRECVALSIVISSQWYIYIFTHFTCLSGPLVAVCGKTLFLKSCWMAPSEWEVSPSGCCTCAESHLFAQDVFNRAQRDFFFCLDSFPQSLPPPIVRQRCCQPLCCTCVPVHIWAVRGSKKEPFFFFPP